MVADFKNIRFQSSTRIRQNSRIQTKIHSGERFKKDGVPVSGFTGLVWTKGRFM